MNRIINEVQIFWQKEKKARIQIIFKIIKRYAIFLNKKDCHFFTEAWIVSGFKNPWFFNFEACFFALVIMIIHVPENSTHFVFSILCGFPGTYLKKWMFAQKCVSANKLLHRYVSRGHREGKL